MTDIDPNIQNEALRILRSLYPYADQDKLERSLYFPLKRCLQIQTDLCAVFPVCMCGREILERSGINPDKVPARPTNPMTARASFQLVEGSGPKPSNPSGPGIDPEPPASVMPRPSAPLFTDAVARKKTRNED